jgi:hypothetical protein
VRILAAWQLVGGRRDRIGMGVAFLAMAIRLGDTINSRINDSVLPFGFEVGCGVTIGIKSELMQRIDCCSKSIIYLKKNQFYEFLN